jgi:hypothetical protein
MKKTLLTAIAAISMAFGAYAQTVIYDYKTTSGVLFDTTGTSKKMSGGVATQSSAFNFKMNSLTSSLDITPADYQEYQYIYLKFPSVLSLSGKGPNKPIVSLTLSANQTIAVTVVLVDVMGHTTDNPVAKQQPSPPNIFVVNKNDSAKALKPFSYNFTNQFIDNYAKPGPVDSTKIQGLKIVINGGFASYYYHKGQPDSATFRLKPFIGLMKIGEIKIGDVIVTGISNINVENNSLTVAPNPSTGNVNVSFSNNTFEAASVSVVNVIGQEVYATKTNASSINLNLSELEKGVYFVRVQSAQGTTTKRLVLN